ncbi:MAG: hypothetical protein LUG83_10950, partial [Lachnospiraceae bacterium]|nr:hypothetical protein [Lachnospiraceae bacterium]
DELSESIMNLLIFLEVDFLSMNNECRIMNYDRVLWKYIEKEGGNQYALAVFPDDKKYKLDSREVCNWCVLEEIREDSFTQKIESGMKERHNPVYSNQKPDKCFKIDFYTEKIRLENARKDVEDNSNKANEIDRLLKRLQKCESGELFCTEELGCDSGVQCPIKKEIAKLIN